MSSPDDGNPEKVVGLPHEKKPINTPPHVLSWVDAANPSSSSDSNSNISSNSLENRDLQIDAQPSEFDSESDRFSTSSCSSKASDSWSQSTGFESLKSHNQKLDAVIYHAEEDLGTASEMLKMIKSILKKNKKFLSIDIWGNFSNSTYCGDLENLCSKSRRIVLFVTKSFEQNTKTVNGIEYLYMNCKDLDLKLTCIKCGYGAEDKPSLKIWQNLPDFIAYENSECFKQAIRGIFGISQQRCSTDRKKSNARASQKGTKELPRQPPGSLTAKKDTTFQTSLGSNGNEYNPPNCEEEPNSALLTADSNRSASESAPTASLPCVSERDFPKSGDSSSCISVAHSQKDDYVTERDQADFKTNKVNEKKTENESKTAIKSQETGEALEKASSKNYSYLKIPASECEDELSSDVVPDSSTEPHSLLVNTQYSSSSSNAHQDPFGTSENNVSLDAVVDSSNDQLSPPLDSYPSATSRPAQPDFAGASENSSPLEGVIDSENYQLPLPLDNQPLDSTGSVYFVQAMHTDQRVHLMGHEYLWPKESLAIASKLHVATPGEKPSSLSQTNQSAGAASRKLAVGHSTEKHSGLNLLPLTFPPNRCNIRETMLSKTEMLISPSDHNLTTSSDFNSKSFFSESDHYEERDFQSSISDIVDEKIFDAKEFDNKEKDDDEV
ncbi:uncharacterized protein LOC112559127 isoform X2 [Pomacea canaliculata]|nr:uncharacterized protein LOC112559127 isoform X2 [Pomacea canaliculata]XP_025085892.1 uncharacterized protein LOC112559127 isoform X2 [Pomacea canaliculata]